MQGAGFQYKYRQPLRHLPGLSPSIAKPARVSGLNPSMERRSPCVGADEEADSAEPESGLGGRMEMKLPLQQGPSGSRASREPTGTAWA